MGKPIVYNRTEYSELTPGQYRKEKHRLQIELLKLQEWVVDNKKRVAIVFEGRDAAGKGSTIKRLIEHLMPKHTIVHELGIPTEYEQHYWLKSWKEKMPKEGQIVFFDRSWYSRALIQPTMKYCTESQYKYFMKNVPKWEDKLIKDGVILIKFYLSITKPNQVFRFQLRKVSELKYWKLSKNDIKAMEQWRLFTNYKDQMFMLTSTKNSPWVVINSNNKMIARLNAMRYVLSKVDYTDKSILKEKDWAREQESYAINIMGVEFKGLTKEQFEVLYRIKANE